MSRKRIQTNQNEGKNINAYKKSLIKSLYCLVFIFLNKCFISAKSGSTDVLLTLKSVKFGLIER